MRRFIDNEKSKMVRILENQKVNVIYFRVFYIKEAGFRGK
tara:strand:- start:6757 stop:6876 length:120 start_codon:yes stop_codon:yes gene_type:complete